MAIPLFIGSILCIGAAFVPAKASATVSERKFAFDKNLKYLLPDFIGDMPAMIW